MAGDKNGIMTDQDIQAFLAIVHYGAISRAAENLNITQPALSKRIARLENELGYTIIERQKGVRNIALTSKGKLFIPIAKDWMNIWDKTKAINDYNRKDCFHVSASDGPHLSVLGPVYKAFVRENPNVNLILDTRSYGQSYHKVENGIIDLAFVGAKYYFKYVQVMPAYSEKMIFICRADSDYPEVVSPEILSVANAIYSPYSSDYETWFDYWFRRQQDPFIKVDLISQVEDFLTSFGTNVWTVVPTSVADRFARNPLLVCRELKQPPPDRIIYYIRRLDHQSKYTDKFLQLLKETVAPMNKMNLFF